MIRSSLIPLRSASLAATMFVACLATRQEAQAAWTWSWEFRLPVGIAWSSPESLNEGLPAKIQVSELYTFGADLMFFPSTETLPSLKGWGAGLRFDSISSIKTDRIGNDSEIAVRLFSFALQRKWDLDFIHPGAYWGPMAAVGIYQPSVVNLRLAPGDWIAYDVHKVRSLSAGLQAGVVLDTYFLFAAEAGYEWLTLDDLLSSNGDKPLSPTGGEKSADLSGPYAKLLLGLHF